MEMPNARRVGNWMIHIRGPRMGTQGDDSLVGQDPCPESEELAKIQAAVKVPGIEWSVESGRSGYLVGTVKREHMGCRIILSLRIAAQSPYRILVGRKVFAEHLANPAALFRAIERCWTKAIGTPDPRDLQMARILAEKGLSCDLVVGNRLNGRHHRGRQEIICVECTTVPDSRFSFRLELGWRCCFLRLWSSRRYKVRDREVLTRLMDRMTAGEFDLRRTPTELPSGIMDAFAVEDVTL